jgi:hypothetical protein
VEVPLAAYVITETPSQDAKVGGPIHLATIGVGMPQVLNAGAVEQIVLANEGRSRTLKTSFLTNTAVARRVTPSKRNFLNLQKALIHLSS